MFRPSRRPVAHALVGAALLSLACSAEKSAPPRLTRFEDLTALFAEWRTFQRPVRVNDVPDYSTAAMARQHEGLAAFRARLAAIDTTGWPVNQQVDWHLVRAEMNGLDFDHRVLRPWANHPSFYVTVFDEQSDQPAREGHYADGGVELWQHPFPLSAASAAVIDSGIRRIPAFLEQARQNLTGTSQDLWSYGETGYHAVLNYEKDGALVNPFERNPPRVTALESPSSIGSSSNRPMRPMMPRPAQYKQPRGS